MSDIAKLKSEVLNYFKTYPQWVNDFNIPRGYSFAEYSEFIKLVEESIPDGYSFANSEVYGTSIENGMIDVQQHNVSVDEHTDDVEPNAPFIMVVLSLDDLRPYPNSKFDTRPVFSYYDEMGKKNSVRLHEGDIITFKAHRPHSMIYYGDTYTVAMMQLKKNRK